MTPMGSPLRDLGRYGSVGIEFVLTIAITAWIGHIIDGHVGHDSGWGMTAGFFLGVVVAFRNLLRTAKSMQRDIERSEKHDPTAGRWTVDESWLHKDDEGAPWPDPDGKGQRGGEPPRRNGRRGAAGERQGRK